MTCKVFCHFTSKFSTLIIIAIYCDIRLFLFVCACVKIKKIYALLVLQDFLHVQECEDLAVDIFGLPLAIFTKVAEFIWEFFICSHW